MRGAWRQYQGDGGNSGFKWRETGMLLGRNRRWRLGVGFVAASPVVDDDGVIYASDGRGELVAVEPDGRERWRRSYNLLILAPPAIAADGTIHFIGSQRREDDAAESYPLRSFVVKANATGHQLWTVPLPDDGFATSAPKV